MSDEENEDQSRKPVGKLPLGWTQNPNPNGGSDEQKENSVLDAAADESASSQQHENAGPGESSGRQEETAGAGDEHAAEATSPQAEEEAGDATASASEPSSPQGNDGDGGSEGDPAEVTHTPAAYDIDAPDPDGTKHVSQVFGNNGGGEDSDVQAADTVVPEEPVLADPLELANANTRVSEQPEPADPHREVVDQLAKEDAAEEEEEQSPDSDAAPSSKKIREPEASEHCVWDPNADEPQTVPISPTVAEVPPEVEEAMQGDDTNPDAEPEPSALATADAMDPEPEPPQPGDSDSKPEIDPEVARVVSALAETVELNRSNLQRQINDQSNGQRDLRSDVDTLRKELGQSTPGGNINNRLVQLENENRQLVGKVDKNRDSLGRMFVLVFLTFAGMLVLVGWQVKETGRSSSNRIWIELLQEDVTRLKKDKDSLAQTAKQSQVELEATRKELKAEREANRKAQETEQQFWMCRMQFETRMLYIDVLIKSGATWYAKKQVRQLQQGFTTVVQPKPAQK